MTGVCRGRDEGSVKGLTLMELMVTLVLSVLVLGMILPLLTSLLKPPVVFGGLSSLPPPWQRALEADLQELVSPSKCGVPEFQILPASDKQPYPELVLETFCRASGTDINFLTRGPSEVRYSLETDTQAGPLVLVRYAKGWHDAASTRYVLANHLTNWSLTFDGVAASLPQEVSKSPTTIAPPARPGRLVIQQVSLTGTQERAFWVPLLQPEPHSSKADQYTGGNQTAPSGIPDTGSPMENAP